MNRLSTQLSIISLILTIGAEAFAGVYSCTTRTRAGLPLAVEITFTEARGHQPQIYTSRVSLNGVSLPLLGDACFYSDRPGTRYVKCAHELGRLRIEIYPEVQTTSGELKRMQFIIWRGSRAEKGDASACLRG